LNKITVFDPEPMMSPDDIFPKLTGSQFYSTFDFCKGYWAIPMAEESKDFTTFVTSKGLMRFKVMTFGMVNSGSTYNPMVRKLLEGAQDLESYVDDVLGHTKDWNTLRVRSRGGCYRLPPDPRIRVRQFGWDIFIEGQDMASRTEQKVKNIKIMGYISR